MEVDIGVDVVSAPEGFVAAQIRLGSGSRLHRLFDFLDRRVEIGPARVEIVVVVVGVVTHDVDDEIGRAPHVETDRTVFGCRDVEGVGDVDSVLEVERGGVRGSVTGRGARIRGHVSVAVTLLALGDGDVDGDGGRIVGDDGATRRTHHRDLTLDHQCQRRIRHRISRAGVEHTGRFDGHVSRPDPLIDDGSHDTESAAADGHRARRADGRPTDSARPGCACRRGDSRRLIRIMPVHEPFPPRTTGGQGNKNGSPGVG